MKINSYHKELDIFQSLIYNAKNHHLKGGTKRCLFLQEILGLILAQQIH